MLAHLLDRAAELGPHGWFNLLLALSTMLVSLGAANRMNKETEITIVFSFATVGAGMLGAMLGYFAPERWQMSFDTILYGGVLGLLIGTRRRTIWMKPEWMPKLSISVTAVTWIVFFSMAR